ncbi:hypothetical protein BGW36DRAFT_405794 [Talaromyces proteolyticus]|uniref:Uncharacterized protein n=1 Tax=Talaromyces proteolyticus TaxID=1131652 RepID=A0AAD4Q2M6_9EURO|nr:uncharacterized protein BGW36DRAFT_405794 [Talaromyces proteolyticus]KAH8700567.1 hypothetical protein BGW36DRAFT_405794 [Talaromyces proteolyticus]
MFSPTSSLFSAVRDGFRSVVSRQIDIQTSRPLRNIADGRTVLSALQKFGEVVTFKRIQQIDKDNKIEKSDRKRNRILAIFDTPEAARKAINASPLTIDLLPGKTAAALVTSDHNSSETPMYAQRRTIQCEISTSKVDHKNEVIRRNPYYESWSLNRQDRRVKDIIAADAPRHVLADCFPFKSKRGDVVTSEEIQGRETKKGRVLEEWVSVGSLMELLPEDGGRKGKRADKGRRETKEV